MQKDIQAQNTVSGALGRTQTQSNLLNGRHVLITGAAGAIGSAVARAMENHGARVTRTDKISQEAGMRVLDACDENSVRGFFDSIADITDIVHSAGSLIVGPIAQTSTSGFRAAVDSNLLSAFLVGREAALRLGGGSSLTFITSQASFRAGANWGVYCAVKAGVARLTEALAQELGPREIRVNAVCPGSVATPMLNDVFRQMSEIKGENPESLLARYRATIPLGRIADSLEIGDVCVFLASPLASYISGASIPVDGGEVSA